VAPSDVQEHLQKQLDASFASEFALATFMEQAVFDVQRYDAITPRVVRGVRLSWSSQAPSIQDPTVLFAIPEEHVTRHLYASVQQIGSNVPINSVQIEGNGPRPLFVTPRAVRFWLDVYARMPVLAEIREGKHWCTIHYPYNHPVSFPFISTNVKVMQYFGSTPRNGKPVGLSLGCEEEATALSLLKFTAHHWLDEKAMSCGLDVIRRKHQLAWPRVIIGTALFGTACNPRNSMDGPGVQEYCVRALRAELLAVTGDVETVCFPFCENEHWFSICVSFTSRQIQIADSLNRQPPEGLVERIKDVFTDTLKRDIRTWSNRLVRLPCPQQSDGSSCGVVVLSFIEKICADTQQVDWSANTADAQRQRWLSGCIDLVTTRARARERMGTLLVTQSSMVRYL